ncbi:MAG: CSLREA domain-containing protein, partial [Planctomycetota bacterium]
MSIKRTHSNRSMSNTQNRPIRAAIAVSIGLLLLAFVALSISQRSAEAASTINVNSTADNLTAGDGNCTLREAITNANNDSDSTSGDCVAGSGDDTIVLQAATYTMSLGPAGDNANATGDFDILDNLTIIGAGARDTIIDGNDLDRIF